MQNILTEKTAKLCFPASVTEVNSSTFGSEEQTVLIICRMTGHILNNAEHPRECRATSKVIVTVQIGGIDTTVPRGSQKE